MRKKKEMCFINGFRVRQFMKPLNKKSAIWQKKINLFMLNDHCRKKKSKYKINLDHATLTKLTK